MPKPPAARRPSSSSGGSVPGSAVQSSVTGDDLTSPQPTLTPSSVLSMPWSRHTSAPPATPRCLEPAKRPRGRPKRASSDPGPAPEPVPDAGSGSKAKKKPGRPKAEIRDGAEDASKVPDLEEKMADGTVSFLRRLDFCKMTTGGIRAAFASGDRSALVPPMGKEFIASLPDLPMAFPHPLFGDDIRIFIGGDMPHCIKKLVNTLEKSGWKNHSRNLRKNGKKLSLQMIQRCWEASGDNLITTGSLRKYRKGIQHFLKDSYSRLNVPLSVQITSLDSIEIINDNCEKPGIGGKDLYAPLAELLEKMDRFIDIVNCTRMNGSRHKGCEPIDAPSHKHVRELLDTAVYLEEWRVECGGFTDQFITKETFEDLCWTIFGIVGVALTYLKEDKSRVMYQQRSGSDVCEHHFSMFRSGNVNPTIDACRQASAKSNSAIDTHLFRVNSKANSGGAKRKSGDYFQPVHKKNRNDQYWDLDS